MTLVPLLLGDPPAVLAVELEDPLHHGREVVVGTALMLIGANSRTVSAAVDAKLRAITPSLPAGVKVESAAELVETLKSAGVL